MATLTGLLMLSFLAYGSFRLGISGFTKKGIPLSNNKQIKGIPAKIIGSICILFGVLCLLAVIGELKYGRVVF